MYAKSPNEQALTAYLLKFYKDTSGSDDDFKNTLSDYVVNIILNTKKDCYAVMVPTTYMFINLMPGLNFYH